MTSIAVNKKVTPQTTRTISLEAGKFFGFAIGFDKYEKYDSIEKDITIVFLAFIFRLSIKRSKSIV
tara:strand:+ start:4661 stop:4858 length:198 start_codon:yes stop_codon:yes gene_type:complete